MPMYSKSTINNETQPVLSKAQTQEFIRAIHQALMKMDFKKFSDICKAFDLYDTKGFQVNLEVMNAIENGMALKENHGKIRSVETRKSRCSACYLGKVINVYRVKYDRKINGPNSGAVIYRTEFGFMLEIRDEQLIDFGFCNSFLNAEEYAQVER